MACGGGLIARVLFVLAFAGAFPFVDYSYDELEKLAASLSGGYAHVTSASALLGTSRAQSGATTCSPSVIRVTHRESLWGDVQRPQLLLSGEIHGDERVGPSATIYTASILVQAANCEIGQQKQACEYLEKQMGITASDQRTWLAHLATRRDTIIIPTANCLGYIQNRREDAGVDPNRDFGYSRSDDECLRSTTARIMNSLMARSLMQIVVTFHGGMVAIGYEWGSPNHPSPKDGSPDDRANAALANSMKNVGGVVPGEAAYPVGRINSLVYPVEGGMEDWMYASGWDRGKGILRNCTRYSNSAQPPNNRALVFLVETSNRKRPTNKELGGSQGLLDAASANNGHVPRNVRLGLMTVDVVQPYVCLQSLSVSPPAGTAGSSSSSSSSAAAASTVKVTWSVGGSSSVDATWLSWHPVTRSETQLADHAGDYSYLLDTLQTPGDGAAKGKGAGAGMGAGAGGRQKSRQLQRDPLSSSSRPRPRARARSHRVLLAINPNGNSSSSSSSPVALKAPLAASSPQKGEGMWKGGDQRSWLGDPFSARFSASASASALVPGYYWLVAWASVDSPWAASGQGDPATSPQSLLVNARGNPGWRSVASGDLGEKRSGTTLPRRRVVQGRVSWPAEPVLVQVLAGGKMTVLASTLKCAWWARNVSAPATAGASASSNAKADEGQLQQQQQQNGGAAMADAPTSIGEGKSKGKGKGKDKNGEEAAVQIVSPGESLDSVLQKEVNEELVGPGLAGADDDEEGAGHTSITRFWLGLAFFLVLALAVSVGFLLSLRIAALRTRASVVLSVQEANEGA